MQDQNSRFKSNVVGLQTIVIKEVTRLLRIWPQTIVPPVITTTLYYVIFGKIIGSRVGEMGNVSYMQFIVPGLVMMSVINIHQRCFFVLLIKISTQR